MTVVVDASVVVAALVDVGDAGRWAETLVVEHRLVAPHLVLVEAANALRRAVLAGQLPADTAAVAHADLLDLPIAVFPYAPFGSRVWQLRENLTAYDAWYVALAEQLDLPLATLDRRLAETPGLRCRFMTAPSG